MKKALRPLLLFCELVCGSRQREATSMAVMCCFIYLITCVLGTSFTDSFWNTVIAPEHPVRILLTLGVVLAISWALRLFTLPPNVSEKESASWVVAFDTLILWSLVMLYAEHKIYHCLTADTIFVNAIRAFAVFLPVSFLTAILLYSFLQAFRRLDHNKETYPLHEIGWLISLAIVLLAIFAFGLEADKSATGKITVRWTEIPAILIVFILAELGIALAIDSKRMTARAVEAVKKSDQLLEKSARTIDSVDKANDRLEITDAKVNCIINSLEASIGTALNWNSSNVKELEAIATNLQLQQDFSLTLLDFARSWKPGHPISPDTGKRLGELFVPFVGKTSMEGTVRSSGKAICCITADAVFAEASENWLKSALEDGTRNVVVWALSTMLPTEFAFPSVYLEDSVDLPGGRWSHRTRSLHRFVTAVIRTCQSTNIEYKRLTVLEGETLFGELSDKNKGQCTLDSWYILDERLVGNNFYEMQKKGRNIMDALKSDLRSRDGLGQAEVDEILLG